MAGLRRRAPLPLGVREALTARLRRHEVQTFDPRWHLVPRERWPSPTPTYVDPVARVLAALDAGEPVDVPAFMISRLADIPREWHRVRIDADGTISQASKP